MRQADRQTFQAAASRLGCWIVIREPTDAAERYRRSMAYVARPTDCVAPAADFDAGSARVAGLVVDAAIHPGVFAQRQRGAMMASRRFYARLGVSDAQGLNARHASGGTPYSIDMAKGSTHFGVLQVNGRHVYDAPVLRAVVGVNGQAASAGAVFTAVGAAMGRVMASVVAAAMSRTAVDEPILAFGPGGETVSARTAGEMSGLIGSIRAGSLGGGQANASGSQR